MNLPKAFVYIPHNFLKVKMHACSFSIDSFKVIFSYLKCRKQNVEINNLYSVFLVILSGVPKRSI